MMSPRARKDARVRARLEAAERVIEETCETCDLCPAIATQGLGGGGFYCDDHADSRCYQRDNAPAIRAWLALRGKGEPSK
jgi:hypothetical protein